MTRISLAAVPGKKISKMLVLATLVYHQLLRLSRVCAIALWKSALSLENCNDFSVICFLIPPFRTKHIVIGNIRFLSKDSPHRLLPPPEISGLALPVHSSPPWNPLVHLSCTQRKHMFQMRSAIKTDTS